MPFTRKQRSGPKNFPDLEDIETPAEATNSAALLVETILDNAGMKHTETKGGWCLREGLKHVISVNDESLRAIVKLSGAPKVYTSIQQQCRHSDAAANMKKPSTCFESLCRIVAGQQLAGAAARTVWNRLLNTTKPQLNPSTVLDLAEKGLVDHLQKPAGLSLAKARSLVDLAQRFNDGILCEDVLQTSPEKQVRELLMQVRGLGPWSCDIFLLFYLERPNILPLGDLAVRKGIAKHFQLRGSGKQGALCPKKDLDKILDATKPFEPYRSLLSYYMWRVADTVDFYNDKNASASSAVQVTPEKVSLPALKKQKTTQQYKFLLYKS
jgi:DNA-3-methyladenine glycosylase II